MKLRNILLYVTILIFATTQYFAQNTNPVVTNVSFSISGTEVTVTYDVADEEQSTFEITMFVSEDAGTTWDYNYGTPTGDIGAGVGVGPSKTILWNYTGGENTNFKIKILANDDTADGSFCPGTLTVDHLGKTYNTIQIADQCWLKENIDANNMSSEQTDNGFIEQYCYNNDPSNCIDYGGLFTWDEAMQYSTTPGTKGVCPTGWHIPTLAEFTTLSDAVGGNTNALKALGLGSDSGVGTNTSGFSALPAGMRNYFFLTYHNLGTEASFWSSTEVDVSNANYMNLVYNNSGVNFKNSNKGNTYSVRCLKD